LQHDETTLEKVAFFYPRIIKEGLMNRENTESWRTDPKEALKDTAVPLAIVSAIGIPVFVIAGAPAYVVRKKRHIKKFFERRRTTSAANEGAS
jgi:hypothetical protein